MSEAAIESARPRIDRGRVLRFMRDWHGYLSALAFIALILFSATGIFLNHPEWFEDASVRQETLVVSLPREAAQAIEASADPVAYSADIVRERFPVRGAFASGEVLDGEILLRFESPRGATDAVIDLQSGRTELAIRHAHPISLINELHRGKNAGAAWRAVIDVVAVLTLAMSLLGYALFLIMRTRAASALTLTVLGLGALVFAAFILVP